jgi:hypothetical protein
MVQQNEEEERAQLLFTLIQKECVKSWRISLKLITVDGLQRQILLDFSYGIHRYISNDHAYDKLSGNKFW